LHNVVTSYTQMPAGWEMVTPASQSQQTWSWLKQVLDNNVATSRESGEQQRGSPRPMISWPI
jgi:hypothetical protein